MRQTALLGTLAATNIGISFLFQWYVITKLGAGMQTDALFAGMTLPQLVLAVVSGSLIHVLVPLLAGENDDRLRQDAWSFLIIIVLFFSVLATLLYATASWWIPFILPGFNQEAHDLTTTLTRIQLIGMVFSAANGVQWAAYHAKQQFIWSELTPILASAIGFILLIWLLPIHGVIAAAWINTLRTGLQTILLAPGMGWPTRPNLRSESVKMAWLRIKPILFGASYYKTDMLIDRFLLSSANSGSLSIYYLAQQLYSAATQVINKAIATPLVPILSRQHKASNKNDFKLTYYRTLKKVGVVGIVAVLSLIIIGKPALSLLIGHGSVSAKNIEDLWWIMLLLSGLFLGGIAGQISSSTFYAQGDTSTPTRIGIYSYTLFIPIKVISYHFHGIEGLALSSGSFMIANFLIQNGILAKRMHLKSAEQ